MNNASRGTARTDDKGILPPRAGLAGEQCHNGGRLRCFGQCQQPVNDGVELSFGHKTAADTIISLTASHGVELLYHTHRGVEQSGSSSGS